MYRLQFYEGNGCNYFRDLFSSRISMKQREEEKKLPQDGKIFGNDDKQTQRVLRSLVTGLQQQHKQLTVYI
jgi:hypothetical protein